MEANRYSSIYLKFHGFRLIFTCLLLYDKGSKGEALNMSSQNDDFHEG